MSTDDLTQSARGDQNADPSGTVSATQGGPADQARLLPEPAAPVAVPGYEILSELGRGAMGVVYKARQVKLNRVVALKMVLVESSVTLKTVLGEDASAKDLIRFLAEAEVVAAIKHQNVVQVYEYGVAPSSPGSNALSGSQQNGRPYLALEFLPGGTLADRQTARGSRMSSTSAAALIASVARGAAAAHALGIVHRDLKPGNILFDQDGTPKLADFGIAKRVDRSGATSVGDIVGTPAYMSPEQAAGDATFVGPPADVWALGVILYECLTGTRPFTGTFLTLLIRLSQEEPPAPRALVSSVPRDLDLICLKCLAKAPGARYPTAKELADDLDRFARGEPVEARPVGPVERGYKWTRRNKVVSAALIAVALALVVGSVVSVGFGLEARRQAERAGEQADRADRERDAAVRARHDAQSANDRLTVARDDLQNLNGALETAFAESLIRPIAAERRNDPLTVNEIDAFWELAARRNTRVNRLFLETATRTPLASKQLGCRAEFALHAAIGLDPHLRDKAEQQIASQFADADTPAEQRLNLALACSRWEPNGSTAASAAAVLSEALAGTTDPVAPFTLARGIVALTARMDPAAGAVALNGAMKRTTHPYALRMLAEGLAGTTAKMRPADAAGARRPAAVLLSDAITKAEAGYAIAELGAALAGVATGVGPEGVDGAPVALLDAMARVPEPAVLLAVATCLAVVTVELNPDSAAAVRDEAGKFLINVLARKFRADEATARDLRLLIEARIAVAPVTPEAVDLLTRTVTAALARSADPDDAHRLTWCLQAIVSHLGKGGAADLTKALASELNRSTKPVARSALEAGLMVVAARTGLDTATDLVVAELVRSKNLRGGAALAESLLKLCAGVRPEQAAQLFDAANTALIDALGESRNPHDLRLFAVGRAYAATALVPTRAAAIRAESARDLSRAMADAVDPSHLEPLAEALAVVARIDPAGAAMYCDAASKTIAAALTTATDPAERKNLANALALVARKLEPEQAVVVARVLASVVAQSANESDRKEAGARLAVASEQMNLDDALRVLADTTDPHALCVLVERIATFAATAPPDQASPARGAVAKRLSAIIVTATDPMALAELLYAFATIEPPPTDAATAGLILDTLARLPRRPPSDAIVVYLTSRAFGLSPGDLMSGRNAALLAVSALGTAGGLLPGLPAMRAYLRPVPRLLPAQALVELLKHPFCVGEARRVVLGALALTYNRPFADQWEFVAYARQHQPHLNLLTPPTRPKAPR